MHAEHAFDRELENLMHLVLEAESGPDRSWAEAPAARQVRTLGRRRLGRWPMRTLAVAAVLLVGGAAFAGLIASRPTEPTHTVRNGWVAFSLSDDGGIYLVREGTSARRITAPDVTPIARACPAFTADGRRIAYAQGSDTEDGSSHDVSLVIADLTPSGDITRSTAIPLAGLREVPCGTWSSDGRWIAFAVYETTSQPTVDETGSLHGMGAGENLAEEVWVVDTVSHAIRRLTGLVATDLDWSPDGTRLAIANDDILVYTPDTGGLGPVGHANGVQWLSWSPDGRRLAYERTVEGPVGGVATCSSSGLCRVIAQELWVMGADGTGEAALETGYATNHGAGPVWSPDGGRLAFQRICDRYPTLTGIGGPCREQHEVVLVSMEADGTGPSKAPPVVIAPPRTEGAVEPTWWYPYGFSWAPDGTQLLYLAWPDGGPGSVASLDSATGLLAVPLDAGRPPVILYRGNADVHPTQAWGRQPGD